MSKKKLPRVSGKEAIKAFEKAGFIHVRTSGSHHILKREGHEYLLSVPVHTNEDLKTGTLRGLLRAAGIEPEDFEKLV